MAFFIYICALQNAGVKVLTDALVYHHPQPHYCKFDFNI